MFTPPITVAVNRLGIFSNCCSVTGRVVVSACLPTCSYNRETDRRSESIYSTQIQVVTYDVMYI